MVDSAIREAEAKKGLFASKQVTFDNIAAKKSPLEHGRR